MIHHLVSASGFLVFVGIAWLLSTDRRKIAWKTIAWGVSLQVVIGLLIFQPLKLLAIRSPVHPGF